MPPPAAKSGSTSRQSVNLFLGKADMKALSHMYRAAWHAGLKTTYYLRTLQASNIEKATVSVKKEIRGAVGETAATYGGDADPAEPGASSPSPAAVSKRMYTPEEKLACSIEAMRNGEACEACQ